MFRALGTFVARQWWLCLILWAAALGLGYWKAPSWESVTRTGEVGFLPAGSPSLSADKLVREAYGLSYAASNVCLIFARQDGPLQPADKEFIQKVVLAKIDSLIASPETPINTVRAFNQEGVGDLLVSEDGRATLVVLELRTSLQDPANIPLISALETFLSDWRADKTMPTGLEVGVTGSAAAGRDLDVAEAASARSIEFWTIVVVIGLLVVLYRAPLVAAIPLVTVGIAVEVAMRLLASIAGTGVFAPSRDLRIFVTVLVYGGGVDYCLFLIARFREELESGHSPEVAIQRSIGKVGGAIAASAGTVIGGIGMLAFARFGKIHEAGLVIPLALSVALLATLTFAGPLLRVFGRYAFWPQRLADQPERHPFWERVGPLLQQHAGAVFVVTTLVLLPFAGVALYRHNDQNFNPLSDLPASAPSRAGAQLMKKYFPVGTLGPVTLLVQDPNVDFTSPEGLAVVAELTDRLVARKDELGLVDVRSYARPLGITSGAQRAYAKVKGSKEDVEAIAREKSESFYFSGMKPGGKNVTRFDLTLAVDPLGREGVATLKNLEAAVPGMLPDALKGARLEYFGAAASLRDLGDVKRDDQDLIQILVSAIVFLLLLIVLHRFVISIYLIVSVLLSYLATLGLTDIVFRLFAMMQGGDEFAGLDWKVPIFLFTILVAVGEDYNIFLLTRVKEENETLDPDDAILHALARTGRVISSCGFVMAGTFASLLSSPLSAMQQLGFALSVGVLIDTLVVRPILVPAFMLLILHALPGRTGRFMVLGKWNRSDKLQHAIQKTEEDAVHMPS